MTPRTESGRQRRALAAAILGAALAGGWRSAVACKCAPPPPVATAVAAAAAVFEGRVAASTAGDAGDEGSAYQVDLAVLRALKGVPAGTRRVTLTAWRGGCELEMAVGRTYVVYASQPSPGVLTTNVCSRTRESARAAEDLAAFSAPAVAPAPRLPTPRPGMGARSRPAAGDRLEAPAPSSRLPWWPWPRGAGAASSWSSARKPRFGCAWWSTSAPSGSRRGFFDDRTPITDRLGCRRRPAPSCLLRILLVAR